MEALINRGTDIMDPFKCVFRSPMCSVHREPPKKPPPDLPVELWLDIFQFATYVHRSASVKPVDPFAIQRTSRNPMGVNTPALSLYTKLALVQVCRAWRQVALPLLYGHIVLRSPSRGNMVLRVLQDSVNPLASEPRSRALGYGQWTRHIEIFTHSRGSGKLSYFKTIFAIFQHCPNVRILTGIWTRTIPVEFLNAMSRMYGHSLEGLCWSEVPDTHHRNAMLEHSATLDLLASFRSLRILDLRHVTSKLETSEPEQPQMVVDRAPSGTVTLPLVEDLILSTHSRSLNIAALFSLPNLRNLTIKTGIPDNIDLIRLHKFLKAHGHFLQSVDLPSPFPDHELEPDTPFLRRTAKHINPEIFLDPETCPNLISISFPVTSPVPLPSAHPTLRRIGLRGVRADLLYPDRPSVVRNQLYAITAERYPKLELVQTIGFLVEADVDIKDVFIWWVEKFEKLGVDLLDGEAVLWVYDQPESTSSSNEEQSRAEDSMSRIEIPDLSTADTSSREYGQGKG